MLKFKKPVQRMLGVGWSIPERRQNVSKGLAKEKKRTCPPLLPLNPLCCMLRTAESSGCWRKKKTNKNLWLPWEEVTRERIIEKGLWANLGTEILSVGTGDY